jgi:formate hydrogenlyase transcriptional activator
MANNTITEDFNTCFLSARNREDIYNIIRDKLKDVIGFDKFCIHLFNENKSFVYFSEDEIEEDFAVFQQDNLPVILSSDAPLIWEVERIVTVPLRSNNIVTGVMYLTPENEYAYPEICLLKELTPCFSLAITNIINLEAAEKRQKEKERLLSLSLTIAAIRNQEDLTKFIEEDLKNVFQFHNMVVSLVNPDRITQRPFFKCFTIKKAVSPEFAYLMSLGKCLVDDGIFGTTLDARLPIVWSIREIMKWEKVPKYVEFWHENQMKKILSVPIFNASEAIGIMFFYHKEERGFVNDDLHLIFTITQYLTVAVLNLLANEEIHKRDYEKEILLSLSNSLAQVENKKQLAAVLKEQFRKLTFCTDSLVLLLDIKSKTYTTLENYGEHFPLADDFLITLSETKEFSTEKNDFVKGAKKFVAAPFKNGTELTGVLLFFSDQRIIFFEKYFTLINGIASQLSVVIANIIIEEEKSLLLSFSNNIAAVRDKAGLTKVISHGLKDLFSVDEYLLSVKNEDHKTHSYFLFDLCAIYINSDFEKFKDDKFIIEGGMAEVVFNAGGPVIFNIDELDKLRVPNKAFWKSVLGDRRVLAIPLRAGNENIGILWAYPDHKINERLMKGVSAQIAIALANTVANEKIEKQFYEISQYKQQLEIENLYLQEEIQTTHNYSEIIGTSAAMKEVFQLVSQVAASQSTVLILGETGTGKELIARAIHNSSPRRDKLMVKVNCAALPANLIESELFGHERGSFTGATERRIGKFELANNSTLFLDEVGELPLDLQVKLLRALQEREIERVGGRTVIKTDVRIIAATNRDLKKEVRAGTFRSDLYFRLEVFPITIPPLRERKEDIPILASHFMLKHAKKGAKGIMNFSSRVIKQLMAYYWPGNVRELEHMIERSILLTSGLTISSVNLPDTIDEDMPTGLRLKTLHENERDHIINVLKACKGKVAGIGGAAEILNLPSTTLNSRIRKLNIKKKFLYDE